MKTKKQHRERTVEELNFFLCIPVAGVELLMVKGQLLVPEEACQDPTKK